MAEQEQNQNEDKQEQQESPAVDYIKAIKEIKSNSVSKEAYDKLAAEHKQLLEDYINNQPIKPQEEQTPVDINELRSKLFNSELTNLEYASTMLELRNAIIAQGGDDPFIPSGHKVTLDGTEAAKAQRAAEALEYCIEMADGDSGVFTAKLQSILKDTTLTKPTRR